MTDLTGGMRLGERIRSRICDTAVPVEDGPPVEVTVSVGVASGDAGEALLAEADAALYAAKRAGRNRVLSVGEET